METFTELLKATAPLMWAGLAIYVFHSLKDTIVKLLESRTINIKFAGNEINLTEATATIGAAVTDIQSKLAELPTPDVSSMGSNTARDALQDASVLASTIQQTDSSAPAPTARILWVDDYPTNNTFLIDRLRGEGHLIDLSLTTADALQRLAHSSYDGVISDLGRKEDDTENPMAGRDLVKAMRGSSIKLPVLIFASSRGISLRDQLLEAGATAVTSSGIDVIRFVNACAMGRKT